MHWVFDEFIEYWYFAESINSIKIDKIDILDYSLPKLLSIFIDFRYQSIDFYRSLSIIDFIDWLRRAVRLLSLTWEVWLNLSMGILKIKFTTASNRNLDWEYCIPCRVVISSNFPSMMIYKIQKQRIFGNFHRRTVQLSNRRHFCLFPTKHCKVWSAVTLLNYAHIDDDDTNDETLQVPFKSSVAGRRSVEG